ncbi:MAG TPA: HAD family hydrolase [Allosphingosinicella sp.]
MSRAAERATPRHVLVFDLDDTLYLERDYVASGFRALGAWVSDNLGARDFAERAWRCFEGGARGRIFDTVLADLGLGDRPELIQTLLSLYRAHKPDIRLAPDARAWLERIGPDVGVALLTDGFLAAQRNKIEALGLAERPIRPIVCTDMWGRACWKPHDRGFLHIESHYRLPARAFTYVADNPAKDFVAPLRLGWSTVWIRRPARIHADARPCPGGCPDRMIESLDELAEDRLVRSARG